ncbi:hypothetical protein [Christiangramia crocea]|uniref:Uncharacterized protein n=1 Tax=Christiangramia crocea TaxID=2904124 RepID=A0A9X1UVV4_9FLAO|nr:hypothetical protein [Gramella crocea]MCG9970348.1 hypothetical protein [Gramella crocea]
MNYRQCIPEKEHNKAQVSYMVPSKDFFNLEAYPYASRFEPALHLPDDKQQPDKPKIYRRIISSGKESII